MWSYNTSALWNKDRCTKKALWCSAEKLTNGWPTWLTITSSLRWWCKIENIYNLLACLRKPKNEWQCSAMSTTCLSRLYACNKLLNIVQSKDRCHLIFSMQRQRTSMDRTSEMCPEWCSPPINFEHIRGMTAASKIPCASTFPKWFLAEWSSTMLSRARNLSPLAKIPLANQTLDFFGTESSAKGLYMHHLISSTRY